MISYPSRNLRFIFFLLFTALIPTVGICSTLFEKINQKVEDQVSQNSNFLQTLRAEIDSLKKQQPTPFHHSDQTIKNFFLITPESAPLIFRCFVENIWELCTSINMPRIPIYICPSQPDNYYNCFAFFINEHEPIITVTEGYVTLFMQPLLRNYLFVLLAHELGHVFYKHMQVQGNPIDEFTADEFAFTKLLQNHVPLIQALGIRDFGFFLMLSLQEIYEKKFPNKKFDEKTTLQLAAIVEQTTNTIIKELNFKLLLNGPTHTTNIGRVYEIAKSILDPIPAEQLSQKTPAQIAQLLAQQFLATVADKKQTLLQTISAIEEVIKTHPTFMERVANLERIYSSMHPQKSSNICEELF